MTVYNSDLKKLAEWWWSLTEVEREQTRALFIQQMQDDPVFAERVLDIMVNEKPYRWGPGSGLPE